MIHRHNLVEIKLVNAESCFSKCQSKTVFLQEQERARRKAEKIEEMEERKAEKLVNMFYCLRYRSKLENGKWKEKQGIFCECKQSVELSLPILIHKCL